MTLAPGSRLGRYQIEAPLGAGGMGEVYRAQDTRLDRTVAIKLLPSHLADNSDLRRRFECEARAIAALNHPHICTLHDVGHHEGIDFLVMECLQGETLAERLARSGSAGESSLPVDDVLRYAIQVADALDKAHRRGIIHRDLKPGNIMLTPHGVKLLDFGLAKFRAADRDEGEGQSSGPTRTTPLTAQGVIVGTPAYMAPEQLEGREADARSDIWALGCVLFEMLTGSRSFGRGMDSRAAVSPTPQSPAGSLLDHSIRKCLSRSPDDRWQSAGDLRSQLEWVSENLSTPVSATAAVPKSSHLGKGAFSLVAGSLIVALLGLWYTVGRLREASAPAESRFLSLAIPDTMTWDDSAAIAISGDGAQVAFVARPRGGGAAQLWRRDFRSASATVFEGVDDPEYPFWSPDSRFIGYFSSGKLRKMQASGGASQTICDAPNPRGGAWNRDGVILFTPSATGGLFQVSATQGEPRPLTTLDPSRNETSHRWPAFLPDGEHFIFLAQCLDPRNDGLYVGSLRSAEKRWLVKTNLRGAYAAPGYLLFLRDNKLLLAQHFDPDRLQLAGEPVPVAENVAYDGAEYAAFAAENDALLYRREQGPPRTELVWFERSGKEIGSTGGAESYEEPQFSPDGRRIIVDKADAQTGKSVLWILDLVRGTRSRISFAPEDEFGPIWSPDGSRIAFNRSDQGQSFGGSLCVKRVDGGGNEEILLRFKDVGTLEGWPDDWSKDGRFIVFDANDGARNSDLWALPVTGAHVPIPLARSPAREYQGRVSPDGRWLAYVSNESGADQVYLQSFPTPEGKMQVSTEGGVEPQWREDGRELFYLAPDQHVMAVALKNSPPDIGVPTPLFRIRTRDPGIRNRYAVAPKGDRFLVMTQSEELSAEPITVILDWTSGLPR